MNRIKKWVGISSAILTSVVLVLSLTGLVGPGCGGDAFNEEDGCEAACINIATCYLSSSSSGSSSSGSGSSGSSSSSGFEIATCTRECRASAASASSSSRDEFNALVQCIAKAPTCLVMGQCTLSASSGGQSSSAGSWSSN